MEAGGQALSSLPVRRSSFDEPRTRRSPDFPQDLPLLTNRLGRLANLPRLL